MCYLGERECHGFSCSGLASPSARSFFPTFLTPSSWAPLTTYSKRAALPSAHTCRPLSEKTLLTRWERNSHSHIHIYAHAQMHTHTCTHTLTHAPTHSRTFICTHSHMCACTLSHTHIHTCAHTHTCTHAFTYTSVHTLPGLGQAPPCSTASHPVRCSPSRFAGFL